MSPRLTGRSGLLFIPVCFALLAAAGCGEGGCGAPSASSGGASSSGGPGAGPSQQQGGAGAGLAGSSKAAGGRASAAPAGSKKAAKRLSPESYVASVDASNFRQKILKGPGALLTLYYPGCDECDDIAPSMKSLASSYAGKLGFYRMDASLTENLAMLPRGFSAKTFPGLILYKEGTAVSWRDGLPSQARKAEAESPEAYQGRFGKWLEDALGRESFNQ